MKPLYLIQYLSFWLATLDPACPLCTGGYIGLIRTRRSDANLFPLVSHVLVNDLLLQNGWCNLPSWKEIRQVVPNFLQIIIYI